MAGMSGRFKSVLVLVCAGRCIGMFLNRAQESFYTWKDSGTEFV